MAEYEEKFIVINKKHIEELNDICGGAFFQGANESIELEKALIEFKKAYEENTDKLLNQKYYVVNQDEPYAKNVIKFILDNENEKEIMDDKDNEKIVFIFETWMHENDDYPRLDKDSSGEYIYDDTQRLFIGFKGCYKIYVNKEKES